MPARTDHQRKAIEGGRKAGNAGVFAFDNPYIVGSPLWSLWNEGWRDGTATRKWFEAAARKAYDSQKGKW